MTYIQLAAMILATTQPGPKHRVAIMTPNSVGTCSFVVERAGPIGRSPSLWQNDVIHRKIANREDQLDPLQWADGIERLHGASSYRMTAVGTCRVTNIVVYADSPPAADLTRIDSVSDIRPTNCVNEDIGEKNRRHNSDLELPKGITVVFALFKEERDGFYESVLTHYWDREVPQALETADRPCPPPLPRWPPVPVPVD